MFDKCVASEIITGLKPELGISSSVRLDQPRGQLGGAGAKLLDRPPIKHLNRLKYTKGKSSIIFRS